MLHAPVERHFMIAPGFGEVKIFFDPNYYRPDAGTCSQIAGLIHESDPIITDFRYFDDGILYCSYNPFRIDSDRALKLCKNLTNYIVACHY